QYLYDYVKIKKLLSFPVAIRKITSIPADYFNLEGRGKIEKGYHADLVLIDLDNLKPNATYTNPMQLSDGVEWVWVNGEVIIESRVINNNKPGIIIRNQAHNNK
ncbi:MAG: amidohydrolase family protein, partial [Bacteroidota bacterium]